MAASPRRTPPSPSPRSSPSARLEEILNSEDRIVELSDSENDLYEDMGTATLEEQANISYLEKIRIPIHDGLTTDTSEAQNETLEIILPYLEGNPNNFPLNIFGIPELQREKHIAFLRQALGDYPGAYALLDASRPWLVYWSLQGLSAMGYDISEYQDRVVHTFSLIQHPSGGYGGGFGQLPHLAPTYAAILSLIMVGGTAAYKSIDRRRMWHFLGQMKQPSGGFTMASSGEEDVRGAYCALVVLSLLHIPLTLPPDAPARAHGLTSFTDKLGAWIFACQSFDGGISASPGNEAHGAYAFCALGCLSILGGPKQTLATHLDLPALIHWLSARQCSPEGGYNGRTNKLVDGCYSHWVGGCWPIVEAASSPSPSSSSTTLWNRAALARYILSAAQSKKGGLIDKPGKRADAYHSCYNLAGLSAAQHTYTYEQTMLDELGGSELDAPYYWKVQGLYEGDGDGDRVWSRGDVVEAVHPVFVVPFRAVHDARRFFEDGDGDGGW